jgi:hypothetical protein
VLSKQARGHSRARCASCALLCTPVLRFKKRLQLLKQAGREQRVASAVSIGNLKEKTN